MRRRLRIQPYVSQEIRRRIQATAASNGVTESSVIEAALTEYFAEKRPDRDLIARRLDIVSQALARLQSDFDLLGDAFGRYVRHLFLLAITKVGPDQRQRAEADYQAYLRGVFDQNFSGARFTTEVRRARTRPSFLPPNGAPVRGQ